MKAHILRITVHPANHPEDGVVVSKAFGIDEKRWGEKAIREKVLKDAFRGGLKAIEKALR